MQQTHIAHRLLWHFEALGNLCQLLVEDTGKGQQLIALIVQCLPELADTRVLLACSLFEFCLGRG